MLLRWLIALAAAGLISAGLQAAPAPKSKTQAPKPPPSAQQKQQPTVKQNFRGRRDDEIYPWEGYEDCPLVVPCVGRLRNTR